MKVKKKNHYIKKADQLCKIKGGYLLLAGTLLASFIISVSLIAISLAIQEFVSIATGDSEYMISRIFIFAGAVVLCYAAAMVMGTLLETCYTNRVEKKIRLLLMGHIMESKQRLMENYHSADLMTRLTVDTERVTNIMPQVFGQMAAEILPSVMALVTMLAMNWKMALVMLAVVPLIIIVISLISPLQQNAAHKDVDNEEKNRSYMTEVFTHLSLFRVYRMRETVLEETKKLYEQKAKSKLLLGFLQGITSFLNNFIGFALLFVTMGVGAIFAVKGEINVGTLIAMVQLTNYVLLPVNAMSGWVRKFSEVKASIDRIEEIMSLPVYEKQKEQRETAREIVSLQIEDLTFRYNENETQVLRGVNAVFQKGTNCIIGESGSGKSTLLKILLGLYEVESGKVYGGDGENALAGSQAGVENLVAYVPSSSFLYHSTIKKNIQMSGGPDDKRLEMAVNQANIRMLIESLEDGMEHEIKESGANLSMGQQQRIAIARALYSDNPIFIFDEPTANLDPEAVAQFWDMVSVIAEGRIVLIVTHDMALAGHCQYIWRLKNGKLERVEG